MISSTRSPLIDLGALARVLACVLAFAAPARAAPAPVLDESEQAAARGLYRRGLAAYRAGDYDQAIEGFQKAYEKTLAPGLLFDIAQAHRRKGECAPAALHFRRFIADAPRSPHRARAEGLLAEMDGCLAGDRAVLDAAPPPVPADESSAAALSPPPDLIPVDPAEVGLATPEELAAVAAPDARSPGRTVGMVLLGATGLALAGGTVFAFRASDAASATGNFVREGRPWNDEARATEADGKRAERLALGLYLTAAACAGVGTWLLLRDESPAPPDAGQTRSPRPVLSIGLAPGAGWATLGGRF